VGKKELGDDVLSRNREGFSFLVGKVWLVKKASPLMEEFT